MNIRTTYIVQTLISLLLAREYVDATCVVTLQQESSTFSIRENSNSLYIPYTCTFSDDGQKSYLTADSYNQNFQKLRTKKIGPAQSLSNSLTRQPFALTLRDGASLDYECNGCSAPFVIKLNCLDESCTKDSLSVTLNVQNELEEPKIVKPNLLLLVAPELSGRSDTNNPPVSVVGNLDCVETESGASQCTHMSFVCRSGYSSNWGQTNCGGGIRAFRLNPGNRQSFVVELQHNSMLHLRASVRNKKFGSAARAWHLIYSYKMPHRKGNIIPTITWEQLASKAQFQDVYNNNQYIILLKRICPSCKSTHKEVIYRRIVKESTRDFNKLWWEYFQLSSGSTDSK